MSGKRKKRENMKTQFWPLCNNLNWQVPVCFFYVYRYFFLKNFTYVGAETKKCYPGQKIFTYADMKNNQKNKGNRA